MQILNKLLQLNIKEMKYDINMELENISEYEFELIKVKAKLENNEEIEMYLKMIKSTKIKESIFCYWCAVYEEELIKSKELQEADTIINKVSISELNQTKYQKSIFLTIENNRTSILTTGTEVNFVDIIKYVKDNQNEKNKFNELYKYIDEGSDDVLLIGIKKVPKNDIDFQDEL